MTLSNARSRDQPELSKGRMEVLMNEIKTESLRLAQARLHLQKLKAVKGTKEKTAAAVASSAAAASFVSASAATSVGAAGTVDSKLNGDKDKTSGTTSSTAAVAASTTSTAASGGGGGKKKASSDSTAAPRAGIRTVPDELLPELTK